MFVGPRGRALRQLLVAFALVAGLPACEPLEAGLEAPGVVPDAAVLDARDARPPDAARVDGAADASRGEVGGPVVLSGLPAVVGCADGTREGFLDITPGTWPDIGGCAGGWQVPGLTYAAGRQSLCGRRGGNTSTNPQGLGCGAADLCAPGWHVCLGPREVERRSPSGCEAAVPPGTRAFFAVAGGGSVGGDCVFGPSAHNDVRGCGTLGQPEADGCFPLDRRLEFYDCLATAGVWDCGGPTSHVTEVLTVWKPRPELGGVLCCRNEPDDG